MALETELKLILPPAALPALRRHPLFRTAEPVGSARWLDNRYYDTPADRLAAQGIALRLRRSGQDVVRTVKSAAAATAGLSRRAEWEIPVPQARRMPARPVAPLVGDDLSDIDDAATRELLERHSHHLHEVFSTRFRRETRRVQPRRGVSILLMLDRGRLHAGDRRAPICELELELERGHPADLFALAAGLAVDLPLQPEDASKAERGYRLAGRRPRPAHAVGVPTDADAPDARTALAAFKRAAGRNLEDWRILLRDATEDSAMARRHQIRVLLRRQRALLRLYRPALPARFVADWRAHLAAQARHLAAARELDVLWTTTLRPFLARHRSPGARLLRLHAARAHRDAIRDADVRFGPRAQMSAVLCYQADLLRLRGSGERGAPATAMVKDRLRRLRRRARRRSRAVEATRRPTPDVVALHRLRLAVKALRDASLQAADDAATVTEAKRLRRDALRLAPLSRDLGRLQDIATAQRWLRTWANARPPLAAAVATLVVGLEPRHRRLLTRALRRAHKI
jgi:inorganic triphosphatase YgiF